MDFIIENWYIIIAVAAIICGGVFTVIKLVKAPGSKQLTKVKEWLLYATTLAEKELGSGTGKLKLRYVYDLFVTKFPWLAKVVTFAKFSELVDDSLGQMNNMLSSNAAVQLFVNGPAEVENTEAEG